jgi:hypothetical protein
VPNITREELAGPCGTTDIRYTIQVGSQRYASNVNISPDLPADARPLADQAAARNLAAKLIIGDSITLDHPYRAFIVRAVTAAVQQDALRLPTKTKD